MSHSRLIQLPRLIQNMQFIQHPIAALLAMVWLMTACQTAKPLAQRDADVPQSVAIGDARFVLMHLLNGSVPDYLPQPELEWNIQNGGIDLTDPDFCFARNYGGVNEGASPNDSFEKNTRAFLEPFAEGVKSLPISLDDYLTDDHSVIRREFGQEWIVVANLGGEDFQFGQTLLPPMGFIAVGPDFVAQHYYYHAEHKHSTLVIINGDEEVYEFK